MWPFSFWFITAIGTALLFALFDVNYFIRMGFSIIYSLQFQKKISVFDTVTFYGICTTQDVGIAWRHMNNARYVRETDFAEVYFFLALGLFGEMVKVKERAFRKSLNVRYRRAISLFSLYKIQTKLVYWDEKTFYFEHRFVTLRDEFVRAVMYTSYVVVGVNVDDLITKVAGSDVKKPEIPEELEAWIRSQEIWSANIRKTD